MNRRLFKVLEDIIAKLFVGTVHGAAVLLRPWRMGRLLERVSLPRIHEHRLRTILTTLGIAIGVAGFVAVMIVNRSIMRGVTSTIDDVAGKADLQISAGTSGFSEDLLDVLREIPGVYKLTPAVQQIATLRTASEQHERVLLLGIDMLGSEDTYFRNYDSKDFEEIRADPLPFLGSPTSVLLGEALAQRHGIKLHDKVALVSANGVQDFEVWGFLKANGVGHAFGGAIGVMYYPALQVAFERGRNLDRIDIAVNPGTDPELVASAIHAKLGAGFSVDRPALRGDRVDKMLTAVRSALLMGSIIALIAAGALVFNTLSIGIVQRQRELGILRALGMTRAQLNSLLTLEGALLGIGGAVWGVVFGVLLSRGMLKVTGETLNRVYIEHATSNVEVRVSDLLLGALLGVGMSTAAAWAATNRVAELRVVEALSGRRFMSALFGKSGLTRDDVVGLVLSLLCLGLLLLPPAGNIPVGAMVAVVAGALAGGALMTRVVQVFHLALRPFRGGGLSVEALLASENLPRDLRRTANTAAGFAASVGLTLSFATYAVSFTNSLDLWLSQSLPGDLFVTSGESIAGMSGRNTPLSPALGEQLAAIVGVERVRPARFADVSFRGRTVKLIATDIESFTKRLPLIPVEGTAEELTSGLLSGKVTVSDNFSKLFDLHRGDTLSLPTKDGAHEFAIAGVSVDYTSDRGSITMDRATYLAAFQDERVDTFELQLQRTAAIETVRQTINRSLRDRYDLFVLTNKEFRQELNGSVGKIFALLNVFEVVTIIVALLGLITALLANVLDRNRELGVLRAVGMMRRQLRKMVMIESMFVALIGVLAGIVFGLVFGYVNLRSITGVQLGWYLTFSLPTRSIIEVVLITLPLSAVAGYLPARSASKLIVTEALAQE